MSATPQQQLNGWIKARLNSTTEAKLPEITDEAVAWVLANNGLATALVKELIRPLVYVMVTRVCAASRDYILAGDDVLPRDEFSKRARRPAYQAWLEHANGRHIRLWEMRHDDLIAAAEEREQRGQAELRYAELWRRLARKVKGKKTVGQVYTEDEIYAIEQEVSAAAETTLRQEEAAD